VGPRVGARDTGATPDGRLGFGDGFRDEDLDGIPNLVRPLAIILDFDSVELVRR
jgi:hypothetical protein